MTLPPMNGVWCLWGTGTGSGIKHDPTTVPTTKLLAGMLVLSSQSRLLGTNPVVWLCDHEPKKTFQKGPPPEKGKLKRWWTYLSQFRLTVHHIRGIKNEMADYISRNNFDALLVQVYWRAGAWKTTRLSTNVYSVPSVMAWRHA